VRFTLKNDTNGANHEVNVTPLIDVSLVLVVMLLLATPLAFESSIDVRKADQAAKKAENKEKTPRVELFVVSEDTVRVNRTLVARSDLSGMLRPLIESADQHAVVVACRPTVTNGAFIDVLDQAKLCGAGEIAVVER